MADESRRIELSVAQVALMNQVLVGARPDIREAAHQIGRGQVVPEKSAEAVASALADVMLSDDGFDGEALTARGIAIDDLIGVVQQMSEHFYD